ncbi:gastric triacylglycerol lipase-like [Dromiciops gliroides]|uniref:gastric triacylglycerol lipase-like n=1 Tax=Dromiciops gliroides TaxID=33562 RepID=UPI001CC802E5|nr:gastric triacylglycerol lipase-like [Dromiciops gliroides]
MTAFMIQAPGTECSILEKPENPEVKLNVSEMIRYWKYPVEEYEVETEDSYILTLVRIPYGRMGNNLSAQRPVVFLQHGLLATATSWVSNLPNNSLGFILADEGFDVWMGNSRGCTYSLKHAFLSTNSTQYWAFSFDEMARYDLPASIDYVVKKTGQKIYYVGHSQGTIIGFLAFSTLPKLAQQIKTFFALGPALSIKYMRSIPFILLFQLPLPSLKYLLGDKDFLPETVLNKYLATKVCDNEAIGVLCGNIIFSLTGFDPKNLNMSRIDVYASHNPAGTSVQNIVHFYQGYHEIQEILRAYDWGSPKENLAHYNQPFPPTYNLSTMKVPTVLWSGLRDLLADPVDVSLLVPQIPNVIYHKIISEYDHLAFIFGTDAPQRIYNEIIRMIKETP